MSQENKETDEVVDFELIKRHQIAAKKPPVHCVVSAKYIDITLVVTVEAVFFTDAEAQKALLWLEKNKPIENSVGGYQIDTSKLSVMP